jgi:hypothetical protein
MIRKKGQTEIMGLAIIVILITIGVLFALKFMRPDTGASSMRDQFIDASIASNTLNVILRTSLSCKDIDFKDLIQDCAEGVKKDYCMGLGNDPCVIAGSAIKDYILDPSLNQSKKPYRFSAKIDGVDMSPLDASTDELVYTNDINCVGTKIGQKYKERTYESYPLPTRRGVVILSLEICR